MSHILHVYDSTRQQRRIVIVKSNATAIDIEQTGRRTVFFTRRLAVNTVMPISCYLCSQTFQTCNWYRRHLRLNHAKHHEGSTVECGQDGCPRIFNNFAYLSAHLRKHHSNLLMAEDCESSFVAPLCAGAENAQTECENCYNVTENLEVQQTQGSSGEIDLTRSFASLIGHLEAKANVTQANIQLVIENVSEFLEDISEYCIAKLRDLLGCLRIAAENSAAELCISAFAEIPKLLEPINTEYKRKQYLEQTGTYIEPKQIVVGLRNELQYSSAVGYQVPKAVEDTMQYVPIEMLLGAILLNERYCDIMREFAAKTKHNDRGVLSHYFDTRAYKSHPHFSKYPESLALNLYVDAFETTNVLGSHTGVHKLEGLYMVVQNFPPEYQSQLSSIFLVALWYAQDVKTYGYDKILDPIVESLKALESDEGVHVSIAGKRVHVRACMVLLSADNLGFNSLFGFCESFSATRYCRFCECSRDEAQHLLSESQLRLRTKEGYNEAVRKLNDPAYDYQQTGIKKNCLLNTLKYWHVTTNYVVDIMHDILEGIAGMELGLLLESIAADKCCKLSIDKLNSAITYFSYSLADRNSRPPNITSFTSLRMSASEMWCFLRNLPLLIGAFIPRKQKHWQLLLQLLEIVDIVFAPVITESMCSYLGHVVEEHHSYFKDLYPDKQLLPKHHFLLHYAKCIRMSGPPVRYWSMRFEARHKFFKDVAKSTNCFKNVCKTLVKRFQCDLAFRLLDGSCGKLAECGPSQIVLVKDFDDAVCETICKDINMCPSDTIYTVSWVKLGHYMFKPLAVAVAAVVEGEPQFGILTDIIAWERKIFLVLKKLDTEYYDEHFHAYAVKYPSSQKYMCVSIDSLKDHIPYQYSVIKYEGELLMLIGLRYSLF